MSLILGIESSCDETAAAVVRNGREALSSVIHSQIEIHKTFGGVVPEIAAREHLRHIDSIVSQALAEADCELSAIDAIAVTQGPGLVGALLVGIAYAKGLAFSSAKALVPVNHVEAHVHGAILGLDIPSENIFPCLALVVSGGHTNIYAMNDPGSFELLAYSIDDACGESFDKVAKLFGLGYPGGPAIEARARLGRSDRFPMPRMMEQKNRLLFSYSGLKTCMVNLRTRHSTELSDSLINDLCASFQEEALGQLLRKLQSALLVRPQSKSILIAGGVAANQKFRDLTAEKLSVPTHFPQLQYCSDNAAMIAALGAHHFAATDDKSVFQNLSWDAFSRYQFE